MFRNQLIIITECLSISLYSYLKFNDFIGFDESLIRKFAIQILQVFYIKKIMKNF